LGFFGGRLLQFDNKIIRIGKGIAIFVETIGLIDALFAYFELFFVFLEEVFEFRFE